MDDGSGIPERTAENSRKQDLERLKKRFIEYIDAFGNLISAYIEMDDSPLPRSVSIQVEREIEREKKLVESAETMEELMLIDKIDDMLRSGRLEP